MSISQVSELIRKKDLSPTELLEAHLRRIENVNGKLNAFITVMAEQAQKSARFIEDQIQKGNHIGPLQGVPIALKDLFNTKGVSTASGSVVMRDFIPTTDSAVAERLKQAGAIIIGKLQMDEFAMGATSVIPMMALLGIHGILIVLLVGLAEVQLLLWREDFVWAQWVVIQVDPLGFQLRFVVLLALSQRLD